MFMFGFIEGIPGLSKVLSFDPAFVKELLFMLFNTVILVSFLGLILYKPVLNFIRKRSERIQAQVDGAAQNLADTERLRLEYEEKLRDIDAERDKILDAARQRAREKEEMIVAAGKSEAELYLSRARLEAERELEKAKDDMKAEMIELSTLMAGLFIEKSIDPDMQNQIVEQTLTDLEDVTWQS